MIKLIILAMLMVFILASWVISILGHKITGQVGYCWIGVIISWIGGWGGLLLLGTMF